MSVFHYHCVIRPPLEDLPKLNSVESALNQRKDLIKYLIGLEKGNSEGKEEYNHYDIVLVLNKNYRVDSLKRGICDNFNIELDKRRNCKVYAIDNERIIYQIGYSQKEAIKFINHGFSDTELKEGLEHFNRVGIIKNEKFKEEPWNLKEIAENYEKYLRETSSRLGYVKVLEYRTVEQLWKNWKNQNKHNFHFGVYSKINKEKLFDYISDKD